MNAFDIIAVIVLSYTPVRGAFRGLIKEFASITGVVYGFYTAYKYYDSGAEILSNLISADTVYFNVISFLIILCGIFLIINVIGIVLKYLMNAIALGWLDRVLGAFFGFLKGVLIVCVLLITFTTFLPKNSSIMKDSVFAPYVSSAAEVVAKISSSKSKDMFGEKIEEWKKIWNSL